MISENKTIINICKKLNIFYIFSHFLVQLEAMMDGNECNDAGWMDGWAFEPG